MTFLKIVWDAGKIRREDPVNSAVAARLMKMKPGAPLLFFPSLGPAFTKS